MGFKIDFSFGGLVKAVSKPFSFIIGILDGSNAARASQNNLNNIIGGLLSQTLLGAVTSSTGIDNSEKGAILAIVQGIPFNQNAQAYLQAIASAVGGIKGISSSTVNAFNIILQTAAVLASIGSSQVPVVKTQTGQPVAPVITVTVNPVTPTSG